MNARYCHARGHGASAGGHGGVTLRQSRGGHGGSRSPYVGKAPFRGPTRTVTFTVVERTAGGSLSAPCRLPYLLNVLSSAHVVNFAEAVTSHA